VINLGIRLGDIHEYFTEERHAAKHVRFVDTGDHLFAIARPSAATLGKTECKIGAFVVPVRVTTNVSVETSLPALAPPPNDANKPARFSRMMMKSMPGPVSFNTHTAPG
jgi:hypothetical protein